MIVGFLAIFFVVIPAVVYFTITNPQSANARNLALQISPVNANQPEAVENEIRFILQNDPNRINNIDWRQTALDIIITGNTGDTAKLVIHSTTSWSAVVQDSNFVQRTVDGSGQRSIDFHCGGFGGVYSVVVQKSTDYGVLNVYVAQDGRILKQANTAADYGVVSIAGNCA